ncbi:ABC-ATPase domain-containing protein [Nocardiopsis ansamitocini]|uniref:ATPase n=1 Tax=Nocardiopsis ansamitocini TaxID=1670832 RepID=A0A9W6P345_9ACTN|nr:ABC-ATPase domain-containing protein [Nocardiopsis ansamitocini]GLU46221.1 ATPase [Nocardiopsis ansamitocini]
MTGRQNWRDRGGTRRGHSDRPAPEPLRGSRDAEHLGAELARMDGASYGRYKSLSGEWDLGDATLTVEKVQADPFAPPSRLLVRLPVATAGLPPAALRSPERRRATADYLARVARRTLKGSRLRVDSGGQEVIDRAACQIHDGEVLMRLGVELPGHGRRIDGRGARRELLDVLPALVRALRWAELDTAAATDFADTVEDATALRAALPGLGLVAFVADGAVLPRASGVSDLPMRDAVPFVSPETMRVAVDLPQRGTVTGMGVFEGVTLIVGGGFHGKSTLLHALERGVYDHVPGDGRELVVTRADAVKIRAEEGRRVERVDVGAFVRDLPTGADTRDFATDNASGSTSQAANTVEALEAGTTVLLVDEDTTATNLMVRDARMQELVSGDREPLTPFVDLVGSLHRDHEVSTVLVMGASGDYFDVADRVVLLDAYRAHDVTERARALARPRIGDAFAAPARRVIDPGSVDDSSRGRTRIKRRDTDVLTFGETDIDLRFLAQVVDPSQVIGLGLALRVLAAENILDGRRTLAEALDTLDGLLEHDGVTRLGGGYPGDYALPRRQEVAATLNRLRTLRVRCQE